MKNIKEIGYEHKEYLRINYYVTTQCPYACRYCPDNLHNGKNREINLQDLETFLNRFRDREVSVGLTGGECSVHPQFKEIVELIKSLGMKVAVDSNSVRTARFYESTGDLVDNWNISLHPSQHTLDLEKISVLTDKSFVVVFVIMDPAYWDLSLDWFDQISNLPNLKVTPAPITYWGAGSTKVEYTSEQREQLSKLESKFTFTRKRMEELQKTHQWLLRGKSLVTYTDGSAEEFDSFKLVREDRNSFLGWECWAGNYSLVINDDCSAGWANCGIRNYKHFLDMYPEDIEKSVICNIEKCNCSLDIRALKRSPN
jgi:hypothetical protein